MAEKSEFYTLKGYELSGGADITAAMEDYLEMICRMADSVGTVRVSELAARLNVKPSSASKMAARLQTQGFLEEHRYDSLHLTERGRSEGMYLLHRHEVLTRFLSILNRREDVLAQVERLEHFVDRETVGNLEKWLERETEPAE